MLLKCKQFFIQSVCVVFILQQNNVLTTNLFPNTVQNLTINAIDDKQHIQGQSVYSSLKLNISWLPPFEEWSPSSYSVSITSIQKREDTNMMECPEGSVYYTSQNKNQLSVLLPQNSLLSEVPELLIHPNCSYKVEVFANPRIKSRQQFTEQIYTVPECIDLKCSCVNAKKVLPIPKVSAIKQDEHILINWTVRTDHLVDSYTVSIGVPLLISKSGSPVYNITRIGTVNGHTHVLTWNFSSSNLNIPLKTDYKVIVVAKDNRGCYGTEGSFSYNLVQMNVSDKKDIIWFVCAGLVSICLFGIFGFTIISCKKDKLTCKSTRMHRLQHSTKSTVHWAESLLHKHNVLYYVDHESEEDICKMERDNYKMSYSRVNIMHELGKGQFGTVYLGILNDNKKTPVAVKMSQHTNTGTESEVHQQFMEEIEIMKRAESHPHLVKLIGYCTHPKKAIYIILEYMQGGDLLAYLHSKRNVHACKHVDEKFIKHISAQSCTTQSLYTTINSQWSCNSVNAFHKLPVCNMETSVRTSDVQPSNQRYINIINKDDKNKEVLVVASNPITRYQYMKFALDIVKGMEHLESKGITHRDLAARNILLTTDLTLKISDFGLSRNGVYVMHSLPGITRQLPIRWMSPEAIRDRAFSSKSDVWSFGVVLWEIGTLGTFPYSHVQDDQLLQYIIHDGGRLERPNNVSHDIYEIMYSCWAQQPHQRPTFAQLLIDLQTLTECSHSTFNTSNPCYTLLSDTLDI